MEVIECKFKKLIVFFSELGRKFHFLADDSNENNEKLKLWKLVDGMSFPL